MHITFTDAAVAQLSPFIHNTGKQLKLLHDTEGCGCVVSGVPALQLIDRSSVDDRLSQGEPFSFWFEPRHEVFYDKRMRIDYDSVQGQFSLKSDSQIYTLNLPLIK